jgi:hypothetical protein
MVSKRVPSQFRQQAVVLVCVTAILSEDEVGGNRLRIGR